MHFLKPALLDNRLVSLEQQVLADILAMELMAHLERGRDLALIAAQDRLALPKVLEENAEIGDQ